MKLLKNNSFILLMILMIGFVAIVTSCDPVEPVKPVEPVDPPTPTPENNLVVLENPYLICAGRNPGGVGFDFVYLDEPGGANNMDNLSVPDFMFDLRVLTVKGELPNGNLKGAPFISLNEGVQAINYSEVNPDCIGFTQFEALKADDLMEFDFQSDDSDFSLEGITVGSSGFMLMSELQEAYKKLVIGDAWKAPANNNVEGDEMIWIIKTKEGQLVKFIVKDFPAAGAPTPSGYIDIAWELL